MDDVDPNRIFRIQTASPLQPRICKRPISNIRLGDGPCGFADLGFVVDLGFVRGGVREVPHESVTTLGRDYELPWNPQTKGLGFEGLQRPVSKPYEILALI